MAPRLDQVRAEMNSAHGSYREQAAHESLHRRTPGIVADAQVGALVVAGGQSVRAHRSDAIDYDDGQGSRNRGAISNRISPGMVLEAAGGGTYLAYGVRK
jgi:hypothetical protein